MFIYVSFMAYMFSYFIVIANICFQIDRLDLLSRILYSVSVSGFRIPCFSAALHMNKRHTFMVAFQ